MTKIPSHGRGDSESPTNRVKVIYIAGAGRSGSTLLTRVLGQAEGFVAVGELIDTWSRNFIRSGHCSCHHPFDRCPTWAEVFRLGFGGLDAVDAREMVNWQYQCRLRKRPYLLFPILRRKLLDQRFAAYRENLAKLYRSIAHVNSARVIVEDSKAAIHGIVLGSLPEVDLYVLHLVRDPRGVASSWAQAKRWLTARSPTLSALDWIKENVLAELAFRRLGSRYKRVRYERFVENPAQELCEIISWAGEAVEPPLEQDGHTVLIRRNHLVVGNPDAFDSRPVRLAVDEKWRTRLSHTEKRAVSSLTLPWLIRYGYPVREM